MATAVASPQTPSQQNPLLTTQMLGDAQEQAEMEINDGSQAEVEDYGEPDPIEDDEELQNVILDLCKYFQQLEKYARRTEVMDTRRQRFYRRGDQYIVWNPSAFVFTPLAAWENTTNDVSGAQDTPRYMDVYDIFWPYMRALISVGVQNPPGVNFEPDDPSKSTHVQAARSAENYRHEIDRKNDRKALQTRVMSLMCTDTRVVLYTRSVRSQQRFGTDETGEPASAEIMTALGTLETKCPVVANEQSDFPYFFISDEIDVNMGKKTYPNAADKITEGPSSIGENSFERFARIGVLQGTRMLQQAGDAFAHLVTRHRAFLRPCAFMHAPEQYRDQLAEKFPDGCKVVYCGDAYCYSRSLSMDDQIKIGFAGPGDGMSRASLMKGMVSVQDAFNDYKNLEKEYLDFGIPVTYRNKEIFNDIEALREQNSEPGNYVDVQTPGGINSLADAFFREPTLECPPELIQAYQYLMGALGQFITGAQPALFGGSDQHNETKGGIAMLRDQAMGQFSIAWGGLQELFAGAYKQGVLCAGKSRPDDQVLSVKTPGKRGKSQIAKINIADLAKGNFNCTPDQDSSFPETSGSKRQTVGALVTQALTNPVATEAYGVLTPNNLELQRELMGVTDWEIPGANSYEKQMQEIELLLEQKPTMDKDNLQLYKIGSDMQEAQKAEVAEQGFPVPSTPPPNADQMFKSTIPVDMEYDFHAFEYQTIKDWLSSPDGLEAKRTNPWGVLNVRLHGLQHKMAMAQGAGPQMPPATPGPAKPPLPMPPPGAMNAPIPQQGATA